MISAQVLWQPGHPELISAQVLWQPGHPELVLAQVLWQPSHPEVMMVILTHIPYCSAALATPAHATPAHEFLHVPWLLSCNYPRACERGHITDRIADGIAEGPPDAYL